MVIHLVKDCPDLHARVAMLLNLSHNSCNCGLGIFTNVSSGQIRCWLGQLLSLCDKTSADAIINGIVFVIDVSELHYSNSCQVLILLELLEIFAHFITKE